VSKIGGLGFSGGNGVAGKAVAEVFQAERTALRDLAGGANPIGPIGETLRHFARRAQMPLCVDGQSIARSIQRDLPAQTGQCVEELAPLGSRVAHVVGGDHGNVRSFSECRRPTPRGFGGAIQMA